MSITILICIFLVGIVNSLTLSPSVLSEASFEQIEIDASSSNFTLKELFEIITVTIHGNNELADMDQNFIKIVSSEIWLTLGIEKTSIHHLSWEFKIAPRLGMLKVVAFVADINDNKISIKSGSIRIEQEIPVLYEVKQSCARTGSRRYGVAGPRAMECNPYSVVRGLYDSEVALVTKSLYSRVGDALKVLNSS